MIPRLKEQYDKSIVGDLQKKFSLANKFMVPRFLKIVLNMGLGVAASDKKVLQNCIEDMSLISGQRPIVTRFKKSISNFKTRKGSAAGVKVTLRSNKMYEFIDRLVNIALPRIKDFKGLNVDGFDEFWRISLVMSSIQRWCRKSQKYENFMSEHFSMPQTTRKQLKTPTMARQTLAIAPNRQNQCYF